MCINGNVINQVFLLTCSLIMEHMFSISDNESETETSEDREESGQMKNNSGSPQKKQYLPVPDKVKGESVSRACRIVTRTHVISVVSRIHSAADHNYKQIQECYAFRGTLWWHWFFF